ncbi:MAG: BREX system Lon protease-like protein BrxL [Anaerolineales bacterium]|nr:BREX system Lon protease-like protein BrxL [Anaerolineales bacterium]
MTTDHIIDSVQDLNAKAVKIFGDLAIDKRRLPLTKLDKRGIPAYVAEWVIDTLSPGSDELTKEKISKIQDWTDRYLPGPEDANSIKNRLFNGETVKVLTSMQVEVELKRNNQDRVAKLMQLQIFDALIADGIVEKYQDLLSYGMWGVTELINTPEGVEVVSFKPMQAVFNLDLYKKARQEFSLKEWMSLLITSMGYNPLVFTEDEQIYLLCRLLPLVQKSMHLIELAPKGTGKSYLYENISPRVRLLSGGNVSPAVLFINNASGQWGLLARFKVVVLDEVQTLKFERPEEIVGGLKGFLANARLTRGGLHESSSDCGLVMLANITLDTHQQPVASPLVSELPVFLQETAFLDRIKGIVPGWKIRKLSGDSFAKSVGLKTDFFGDALLAFRDNLEIDQMCARRIQLTGKKFKRNEDAIHAIASGMTKLLFPHGVMSDEDFEHYCVRPAKQLRQFIWDQLYMLDAEYRQFEKDIQYEIAP